jgi:SAM-dependent methyltransferase
LKPLPIADNSIDEILCSHNIEHIKYELWPRVLYDFHRVLKVNGLLLLTYPEFEVCSKFFLENHRGLRDFWRACLYGRQAWAGDYHVTPVVSSDLAHHLTRNGFDRVMWTPEPVEVQNTIMRGLKSSTGVRTREDVIRETFYEEVQK